jgi:hypothetical protein
MEQVGDSDTKISEYRKRLAAALEDLVILQRRKRSSRASVNATNDRIAKAKDDVREIGIRVAEYESLNSSPRSAPAWQLSSLWPPA